MKFFKAGRGTFINIFNGHKNGQVGSRPRFDLIGSDHCCGSGIFITDPTFFHPGSRIGIKEFKYFNPKKTKEMVSRL
jgi:hypothetical protein